MSGRVVSALRVACPRITALANSDSNAAYHLRERHSVVARHLRQCFAIPGTALTSASSCGMRLRQDRANHAARHQRRATHHSLRFPPPSMPYLHHVECFVHDAVFFAEVQRLLVHGSHAHAANTKAHQRTRHTPPNKSTGTLLVPLDARSACALAYAHWFTLGFGPCKWGDGGAKHASTHAHVWQAAQYRFHEGLQLRGIEFGHLPTIPKWRTRPCVCCGLFPFWSLRIRTHPDGACQALFLRAGMHVR